MDEKTITRERVVATRSRVGIASLASVIEFPIIGSLRVVKKTIEDGSLLSRRLFAWSGRARLPLGRGRRARSGGAQRQLPG